MLQCFFQQWFDVFQIWVLWLYYVLFSDIFFEIVEDVLVFFMVVQEVQVFVCDNVEVWEYFVFEVYEYFVSLCEQFGCGEDVDFQVMFCVVYIIKGSVYMVGLLLLGDFVYGMEDLLGVVCEGVVSLSSDVCGLFVEVIDIIGDLLMVVVGVDGVVFFV